MTPPVIPGTRYAVSYELVSEHEAHSSAGSATPKKPSPVKSVISTSSTFSDESYVGGVRLSQCSSIPSVSPKSRLRSLEVSNSIDTSSSSSEGLEEKLAGEAIITPEFQVGLPPDDDVFSAPVKKPLGKRAVSFNYIPQFIESPVQSFTDRRKARAASSGTALVVPSALKKPVPANVDAQGIYPASSCVFVANLAEPKDDLALEAAVTREFGKFGTVFVKIKRDNGNIPFAFCQYTNDQDAKTALEEGKGTMVFGRACRTEMAKANRAFLVYKIRGLSISVEEALAIFEPFGVLSKCEFLPGNVQEAMGKPTAVLVEFAAFDPFRDLSSIIRQNSEYRIEPFGKKKTSPRVVTDAKFLNQYDIDRRSIYVTGIPIDVTEDEIADFFAEAGEVKNVHLVKKPAITGLNPRVFAFVEFAHAGCPDVAIHKFRNEHFRDHKLKIERKHNKQMETIRRVKSGAYLNGKSSMEFQNPAQARKEPATPNTPKTPHASGAIVPVQTPTAMGMNIPTPMTGTFAMHHTLRPQQSFVSPGFFGTPVTGGHIFYGQGGMPGTPATPMSPFGPGGMYPHLVPIQDPVSGFTYFCPTTPSPVAGGHMPQYPAPGQGSNQHC
ncbi:hypothetical protein B0H63DRAFT_516351 [Podospora didyma]|uniref:RRM domain-containing protein n=1 Tax=Podospora didyma TaxID=330526 RepID=A0AAE0JWV0_9PEZI|nr:hypothetical protein B0H63DRAFT_530046 [Podospora didyma]KAK3393149.1 hypothetical protein B0H63DRAFT_516351 [Podospora didyma]